MNLSVAGAVLAAYLLGAVPFGLILSKTVSKRDPREFGSGNIGATNAMRTGGKLVGVLTLVADIAKGAMPVSLALFAGWSETAVAAVAAATFLGHIFPVYLKFSGGKGVATMLGVMLPWQPLAALIGIACWAVVLMLSGYVSLASVLAALLLPILLVATGSALPALLVGTLFAILVTMKHASNIRRLISGTESSIRQDSRGES